MAFYKLGTREGGVNPTGNAVEANVLKDKTFSNASGINKIGTMPDNSTTTSNGTVPGINSSYPNIPIRPGSNLQMGVNTDGVKQLALEPPQGYYPGGGSSYIGVDADDLGDAVASDVVSGKTFTSESGIEVVGTMPNNGAVSPSALSPNGSYTIPEGYHNGNGVVTASPNTGTYSPTTRNVALDMGISNLNRYVNTNGVPNSNSGTYTFASGDTGGTKDLGVTNTYRYVNATNVYNKGKFDASKRFYVMARGDGANPDASGLAAGSIVIFKNDLRGYTYLKGTVAGNGGNQKNTIMLQECNNSYVPSNSLTFYSGETKNISSIINNSATYDRIMLCYFCGNYNTQILWGISEWEFS